MENLITAGITIMTLVGLFAVPTLLATLAAMAMVQFQGQRENGRETRPSLSTARLGGAVAYVLAVGLLLAPGSFAEDLPTSQINSGPEREEYRLWPVVQHPKNRHADEERLTIVDFGPAITSGPEREEYRLWPVIQYPKSTAIENPMLASR